MQRSCSRTPSCGLPILSRAVYVSRKGCAERLDFAMVCDGSNESLGTHVARSDGFALPQAESRPARRPSAMAAALSATLRYIGLRAIPEVPERCLHPGRQRSGGSCTLSGFEVARGLRPPSPHVAGASAGQLDPGKHLAHRDSHGVCGRAARACRDLRTLIQPAQGDSGTPASVRRSVVRFPVPVWCARDAVDRVRGETAIFRNRGCRAKSFSSRSETYACQVI
jgi:hypothetical protein